MTSPICTVNGSTTGNGVNVAANALTTIALADTAGVKSWSLRCISTDENQVAATISAGLTISQITKQATFTSPNVTNGAALIFESEVNGGLDINGRVDSSLTTRFGVYVLTVPGSLRVGAFDETMEGDASFGWTSKFNAVARTAANSALSPSLSGTLPITVNNSNPAAPVIGINAATSGAAGSMSAADKTKLDAAAVTVTPDTLALRGGAGQIAFSLVETPKVYGGTSILEFEVDGAPVAMTITDHPKIEAHHEFSAPSFKLKSAVTGIVRSCPLDWRGYTVAGAESWVSTNTGTCKQNVIDATAECYVQLDLIHGVVLTNVYVKTNGETSGPGVNPGNLPVYDVVRQHMGTLAQTVVGTASDAGGMGVYRVTHWTTVSCSAHVVDRTNYRYYVKISPEYGSDSVIGLQLDAIQIEYSLPAGFSIGLG